MIYLFYGTIHYLIQEEIKKLKQQNNIEDINCPTYDLENDDWKSILEDVTTVSLFSPKKMVIVENSYIFTGTTKKGEQDITIWEQYLNHPNPDSLLIFIVHNEKVDERKKIVKFMEKNGIVKEFNNANIENIIQSLCADYQIDGATIHLLIDRIGNDLYQIKQEIEKIKLYKNQDKKITKEDILLLTNKKIDTDIFELIDSIVTHNQQKAFTIYQEMLKQNEEPIKIIVMLANQFRILYQSKKLNALGHSENDIASILAIHPYRVKLALQKSRQYTENQLLSYLNHLAEMDFNIKSGLVNKNAILELFILQ